MYGTKVPVNGQHAPAAVAADEPMLVATERSLDVMGARCPRRLHALPPPLGAGGHSITPRLVVVVVHDEGHGTQGDGHLPHRGRRQGIIIVRGWNGRQKGIVLVVPVQTISSTVRVVRRRARHTSSVRRSRGPPWPMARLRTVHVTDRASRSGCSMIPRNRLVMASSQRPPAHWRSHMRTHRAHALRFASNRAHTSSHHRRVCSQTHRSLPLLRDSDRDRRRTHRVRLQHHTPEGGLILLRKKKHLT